MRISSQKAMKKYEKIVNRLTINRFSIILHKAINKKGAHRMAKNIKFDESKMPAFAKDNSGAAFFWKIRNIKHSRMIAITEMLEDYKLHYTQPPVLGMIDRMDEPTQKELAEAMNTSAAAMSATLKRLEKAGLIQRISLEEDTRKNKIKLTEKGRNIHEDTFGKTMEIDKAMLKGFSDKETKQLFAYLDRIQANVDEIKKGNEL